MRAQWRSLAWKIGATNTALVVFVILIVLGLEYRKDRQLLEITIRRELAQSVFTGAQLLSGANAEALVSESASPEKEDLDRQLRVLESANPAVARLYVLARTPTGALRWLGPGISDPAKLMPAALTELQVALDRDISTSTAVYEDANGQWVSAFHPIRDRDGRAIAVLGADFRVSALKAQARGKLKSILVSGSVAALAAALLSLLIARNVTHPLKLVAESTSQIAAGNLNICLHTRRRDEIGDLAKSFNQMVEQLAAAAEARDRLHQQILEKQKLEQELSLAAAIQQSFLPVSFPWSPKYRSNARTVPAESVGGDFYDFIELPRDRLGIVIGDVAGRGIAAAVYMARAISEFRTAALRTDSPRDALERLNRQLLTRSTRGMFVTMTYLILDTSSGEVSYSSGGHLPALRRRGRTGAVEVLKEERGLPLGIAARPELDERHLTLETHDTLLLITDGVIEGLSRARADIAINKLLDVLRRQDSNHDQLVDTVFEEIAKLSPSQCPQDDMTVLSLAWLAERPSAPNS